MSDARAHEALAAACADDIYDGFSTYNFHFHIVTQRAAARFAARDFSGTQRDAVQRIELYEQAVQRLLDRLAERLGDDLMDRHLWRTIKLRYEDLIRPYLDREFTKTFFSSVTRRVFRTVGVDPQVEFVAIGDETVNENTRYAAYRQYFARGSYWAVFHEVMRDIKLDVAFTDLTSCVNYVTTRAVHDCVQVGGNYSIVSVDVVRQVFYRDNRAYVIGRINGQDFQIPLVIAIANTDAGARVDGVITGEDGVSIIFSFSRSYIHADLDIVRHAVAFLHKMLPRKPVAELYTALGRAKQGKTERYRNVFAHLQQTSEKFYDAAVDRGMVMIVFALPSYPVVFKVIRDRFAYPKTTVRRDVLDAYKLVFKHDRAGRLIDAQEFRHLKFRRERFDPELLDELTREAGDVIQVDEDNVIIEHLYVERKLVPLNQYVRQVSPQAARAAVIDYGDAIADLASSNIFPGDLLLKNFGVTRHGRVVFFDYDELCLVTDCNFRDLPAPRTHEEEMSAGAWFYVGEDDVFPEQFPEFLGLEGDLLDLFRTHHHRLLDAQYWRDLQAKLHAGQVVDLLPYTPREA
ncbi:MAG: bifunctional isocitrate dehydrogenase kinase/phosphatase [Pseudomonadota bacterium]